MKIKESKQNNVMLLTVSGNMMGGPETEEVHDHVSKLVADGTVNIVIDLSDVKWMNSSGLGVLMASFATCLKNGGNLKLCRITEKEGAGNVGRQEAGAGKRGIQICL